MIRILDIQFDSVDNGTGLRTVIYVSGCSHFCFGCHNAKSWNVNNGYDISINELVEIIKSQKYSDVTISGGDPLTLQYSETLQLVKQIKKETGKNIWLYTGYTYEELSIINKNDILNYVDVLIDGKFDFTKRDLKLKFRGSSNQRLIDVKETKKIKKIIKFNA